MTVKVLDTNVLLDRPAEDIIQSSYLILEKRIRHLLGIAPYFALNKGPVFLSIFQFAAALLHPPGDVSDNSARSGHKSIQFPPA